LTGVQASSEYTVPSGGVPGPIFCLVTATNAGGFSTAGSTDEITPPAQTITTNVTSTSTTITSGAVTTFVTVRTSETTATATVATATTPVTLAETPSVRPTLDVVSRRCAKQRCTVVVSTQDVGGPGVRTVSATLTHLTRVACPASTRRTTCPRSVRVHDSVTALTGGRFQITGADLAPGSYELTLVAIDRSGRRQSRTTIVSLAVPR